MSKVTASLSRFAVLKIDDDEDEREAQRARDKQRAAMQKLLQSTGKDVKKRNPEQKAAQKSKAANQAAQLQSLAFGGVKTKKSVTQKKTKPVQDATGKNWDNWKEKDEELVGDAYEAQLREALLASKLEFEENKTFAKTAERQESLDESHKKKPMNKKGTTTMSLDQFNYGIQEPVKIIQEIEANGSNAVIDEEHFFEEVDEEAKRLANKEKFKAELNKKKLKKSKEQVSEEPRLAQLDEELRQSKEEVERLRLENEKLREELLGVKTRNKRLCGILVQGEMKEKSELIVEMEKITKVKEELTAELENVSSQLQQERSKVTALSDPKKVYKKKPEGEK